MSEMEIIDSSLKIGKIRGPDGWVPCLRHTETGITLVLADPNLRSALEKEFIECSERNSRDSK